jgi:serine O-acetyltransferase
VLYMENRFLRVSRECMGQYQRWLIDLQVYGGYRALFAEQSLWAILIHRVGAAIDKTPSKLVKNSLLLLWWPAFRFFEMLVGVSLPKEANIGGGLRVWHFGGVFVHPSVVIGDYCVLRQGVTIGNKIKGGDVPKLGNYVEIGAYAQILGGVHIGDHAVIGAMSVVLNDVEPNLVVAGIPAKIIHSKSLGS